jgi:hypothetical protein
MGCRNANRFEVTSRPDFDSARYERYEIQADQLLEMHDRGQVYKWPILVANEPWADFDDFEVAFRKAIEIFHRRRSSAPVTMDWWINRQLTQQRPDSEILDRTFRRARGMARRHATERRTTRNLPPRLPNVRGAIWVRVHRLLDAHETVWLRCQSPRGYPSVLTPRPTDDNDMRVIKAAYPSFFSPGYDGPQQIYCAARWRGDDWVLLVSEQPRASRRA